MADITRFKDLQEAQKRLDQLFTAESMKRNAAEQKIHEQFDGMAQKFEHLTTTLAEMQLQMLNMSKNGGSGDSSVLGPFGKEGNPGKLGSVVNYAHSPLPRLDFPRFDGSHPRSWIVKCNSYFKLMPAIPDSQKVHLATMHFDGKALFWFQNLNMGDVDITWEQFLEVVSARFEDLRISNIVVEFNKLKQTGSYEDYVEHFNELKACLIVNDQSKYSEEYFMGSFLSGLSEELQAFISMFQPQTLEHVIELGRKQLATLDAIAKRMKPPTKSYQPQQFTTRKYENNQHSIPARSANPHLSKPPIKLLTSAEMAARRDKGLCYNCDEPYVFGHRCKNRINYLMMTEEEEILLAHDDVDSGVTAVEGNMMQAVEEVQISLHSMMGEVGLTTMRVVGEVGQHKLNILLDTGSTLSFLQEDTAQKLGCLTHSDKPLLVRVANGQKLISTKRATDFKWTVQGHEFQYSPRLLRNEGCDMILGGDWLRFCTPIELDYANMQFTVTLNGKRVGLKALTSTVDCQVITGPVLSSLVHEEVDAIEEIFVLQHDKLTEEVPLFLHQLLKDYAEVFEEPIGLPPVRGVEHHIMLHPSSKPKQQHPYRTSHSHKDEIEKIVLEMLRNGIIQHSRSPFASPVILVKKKDNTWRLCVDYRYLNSLTVKHDFPIPLIDDLLDELFGARFFSKIDLRSGYFQILVRPEDRHLTAFSTHHGHFEFLVMPFGLCNAPATFQSLMNQVFQHCLRKFVLVFFDDILVYSKSMEEHKHHLGVVLDLLKQHTLFAKRSKCNFGQEQVEYLGHIISAAGVSTDPTKIACMLEWPKPKTVKQLRGFLGLTGYYRKFIVMDLQGFREEAIRGKKKKKEKLGILQITDKKEGKEEGGIEIEA